jgi:small subunit ribosomal protein S13
MPRIVGVDIPNDKSIWISLTYIVGIGKYTSGQILKEAGIDKSTKAGKLSEDELSHITQIIDYQFMGSVLKVTHVPAKDQEKQLPVRKV